MRKKVCDLVGGEKLCRNKILADAAFGGQGSIYFIINKVKASKDTDDLSYQNSEKTKKTVNVFATVLMNNKEDHTQHHLLRVSQLSWGLIWDYEQDSS
jgi:hypothetical protein